MFIDFVALKRLCSLEQVALWLGLEVKNGRCQCPVNEGDDRELAFTFNKGIWSCHGCKKPADPRKKKHGGDQIALVQHVLGYPETTQGLQDAAKHLHAKFHGHKPTQRGLTQEAVDKIQGEMEHDHDEVLATGMTADLAQKYGVGWRERGVKRQTVLFPLKSCSCKPDDYIGYSKERGLVLTKVLVVK